MGRRITETTGSHIAKGLELRLLFHPGVAFRLPLKATVQYVIHFLRTPFSDDMYIQYVTFGRPEHI